MPSCRVMDVGYGVGHRSQLRPSAFLAPHSLPILAIDTSCEHRDSVGRVGLAGRVDIGLQPMLMSLIEHLPDNELSTFD